MEPTPDDPLEEGRARRAEGDVVGAEAAFREALARDPVSADAFQGLAAALADQDRFDAALRVLTLAAERAVPDDRERRERLRADIFFRSGRPEAGIAALADLVRALPAARGAWQDLAFALLARGEAGEADGVLARALVVHPRDADLWGTRGLVAAARGEPREAARCYREALSWIDGPSPEKRAILATHLANALDMAGESERAIAGYRAVIAEHEGAKLAYVQLGIALWRQKRFGEAAKVLEDTVGRWREEHHAHYYLADSLRMLGRKAEAEKVFGASVARWPECPECLLGLAEVRSELGRPEEAALLLRHVLAQQPENANAIGLFADARYAIGEREEARKLFEAAIRLAPGEVRHVYNFALRERQAGEIERASALFDRALEIAPHLDRALYFAAVCRLERGLREEALRFLRRFVTTEPRSRPIVRADPILDALKSEGAYRELVGGSALDFAAPGPGTRAALVALAQALPAGRGGAGPPMEDAITQALAAAERVREAHGPQGPPPRFYFETRVEGPALVIGERDARDPEGLARVVAKVERLEDGTFVLRAA